MTSKFSLPTQSAMLGTNSDRIPFWGMKTSPELRYLAQIFNKKIAPISPDRPLFRDLFKFLFYAQTNGGSSESESEIYEKLKEISEKHKIDMNNLTSLYAGILKLFNSALRASLLKQDVMKEDLIDFLKFTPEIATDFAGLIYGQKREAIEQFVVSTSPKHTSSLKKLTWRIDVSISTSSLSRTLEPFVLVQMHLSDGRTVSFEMSLTSFHNLRFNVAMILKEMDDLLNRQMFKLIE